MNKQVVQRLRKLMSIADAFHADMSEEMSLNAHLTGRGYREEVDRLWAETEEARREDLVNG